MPRICLACRFGLTQRSAVLGFRAAPITHSLSQRRRYTSEIGKTGDGKIESFITGANIPAETKSKEEESSERTETGIEAATTPEDTTDVKPSSEAETNSEPAPRPEDNQDTKPIPDVQSEPLSTEPSSEKPTDPVQETRDETTSEAVSVPRDNQDVISASNTQSESPSAEPCPEKSINPEQKTQDETETQVSTTPASPEQPLDSSEKSPDSSAEQPADGSEDSMFELPILPELEPTVFPTKRFRHDLVHDESLGVSALGVPADAIIINNPNQIRRSKKAPTVIESQPVEPPPEFDWQRLTPSGQEDEPDAEEIYRNIDELRPDNRFLRDSEIESLAELLREGFTTDQLKEYSRLREAQVVVEDAINYPWIVKHVPWTHPSKTEPRSQDKLSYVQRIIFDKWKIEGQKDAYDIGRAIVQMEPEFFVFLTCRFSIETGMDTVQC